MLSELSVITIADVLAVIIVQRWHVDKARKWHKTGARTRDLFGPRNEDSGVISWAFMLVITSLFGFGLALLLLTHVS